MRIMEELPNGVQIIKEMKCDACQASMRVTHPNGTSSFEAGHLHAKWEQGFHAGDRFLFDLCQSCFDDIVELILVLNKGTCIYTNIYNSSMTYEHMLAMYAARAADGMEACSDEMEFDEPEEGTDL
jgi:hypothetical protein